MAEDETKVSAAKVSKPAGSRRKKPLTVKDLSPYHKAAILIIAIGVSTAANVLKHLPEEEVEKISVELAKLRAYSQSGGLNSEVGSISKRNSWPRRPLFIEILVLKETNGPR